VRPERESRERCGTGQASGRGLAPEEQEEEGEIEQGEQPVRSGFARIDEQQRAGSREGCEPEGGPPPGKAQRRNKQTQDRDEREEARDRIALRHLREPDKWLLEEVEKRRAGILTKNFQETRRGQARRPQREDLVVPKRPNDQEREARDEGGGNENPEHAPTWSFRKDALF
jgi:hypothetical protein